MQKDHYKAPEWAKHVIWYQIFPERFCNGDPSNDPTPERLKVPKDWAISPWTGDWYERAEWEKSLGDNFRDSIFKRRYGGDLQGIIDKLDYLQELGIGGLYLNPVFDAVSLHKYDTSYYHHVDRFFGPDPQGDAEIMAQENPADPDTWQWTSADRLLLELIEKVHKRGMKIIIDGVFNHTGTDFWAFRDVSENQEQSFYKDWYSITSFAEPDDPDAEFDYDSWWGFKSLPELKERNGTLVEPVRKHIFNITRRWMDPDGDGDPSDGIDGWRLDVPDEIGKDFWREWCAFVRSINPEAFMVGEIWSSKSKEWVGEDLFTATMNYPFTEAVQHYMINRSISPSDFLGKLRHLREGFPDEAVFVLQNLMDSHDTPRVASMVVNPGREFNRQTKPEEGFEIRKPNIEERRIQKLIALFQYTYVGAPMIYYGTEAGMWGADDPDNRKPMLWSSFNYDQEVYHPLNKERPADENKFDEYIYSWYKKLGDIRNNHLALRIGDFKEIAVNNAQDYFAFARIVNKQKFCLVVINRSRHSRTITIPLVDFEYSSTTQFQNVISGTRVEVVGQELVLTLPQVSGAILVPKNSD